MSSAVSMSEYLHVLNYACAGPVSTGDEGRYATLQLAGQLYLEPRQLCLSWHPYTDGRRQRRTLDRSYGEFTARNLKCHASKRQYRRPKAVPYHCLQKRYAVDLEYEV